MFYSEPIWIFLSDQSIYDWKGPLFVGLATIGWLVQREGFRLNKVCEAPGRLAVIGTIAIDMNQQVPSFGKSKY